MKSYSFIIPHKNSPCLLSRCLDSIPERDDVEIIVVDDNSDEDLKPYTERDDTKIIFLDEKSSCGAGHARNIGIENATGKWLLFADCDDYYMPNFLMVLDRFKDQDIDILYFRNKRYFQKDDTIVEQNNWIDKVFDHYFNSKQTIKDAIWLGLSHNAPWNKMFSKSFIDFIGCRFEEIPMGNDAWFVNYAGASVRKIAAINDVLYNYIQLNNGITNRKRPLSHHISVISSDKKRNKIKVDNRCYDLLFVPGFNKEVVIRDYGAITFWLLFFKRVLTEPYFDLALLLLLFRKLKLNKNVL